MDARDMHAQGTPTPSRRLIEAAAWRVRLTDAPDETSTIEFEKWLAADSRNAAAWRQVAGPWELFGEHAASPELLEARKQALSRAQRTGRERWASASARSFQAIAATVLCVVAVAFFTWHYTRFDVYRTGPSERHTSRLADGSTITLDGESEVRVRYTSSARTLSLIRGQARFDVARDELRPFTVTAQNRKVIATGTSFNVDMLQASLFVTLIEGRVVVVANAPPVRHPGAAATLDDSRIVLAPGQQLAISPSQPPMVSEVNVSWTTAWQTGNVVFEDETLAQATARLNRYSKRELIVSDSTTAERRISGVFKIGDVDGFVDAVTSYLPIAAENLSNGDISLSNR